MGQQKILHNMEDIIKNSRPCTTEEDIRATLEINRKMLEVEDDFRRKCAASVMEVERNPIVFA